MSFKEDIKQLRTEQGLTQQGLADKMHVSRQTVSTWETGKNDPNLDILRELSQLFGVSFEKLVFGEEITMKPEKTIAEKVDQDLINKGRYKKIALILGSIVATLALWVGVLTVGYINGVSDIDRFNPFLSYTTAYTKLPSDKVISPNNSKHGYWTAWFTDNEMGSQWSKLMLTTGLNPSVKDPYVMVYHKGSYVKIARIVPGSAVNTLVKGDLSALDSLLTSKKKVDVNEAKPFHDKKHLSMTVQKLENTENNHTLH
ncbi:helix-turn-helix domain-containing protein [Convivina intestini]|uniref:helix-turn-helix domain-containing protein n=1 Tax=Convivina intestini TaxID=1505726 RepID=UPI00200FCCA5|nr:helix-turn-helix transcriptional regulator [Convivina intestini]CAH1856564.1 hypothetical protein R078131_01431 [Convivina intestini]